MASEQPATNKVSAAAANECRHEVLSTFIVVSPSVKVAWGRAQAVQQTATITSAAGRVVLAKSRRTRPGARHDRVPRSNSRSTRRPRLERKPGPSTDSQPSSRPRTSRLPIATRQSANRSGPPGTSRLASSAAASLAARSRCRSHHTSGCHHNAAHSRLATTCQAGSRAARWANSWASTASCCRRSKSSANVTGRATVGRKLPKATGDLSPAASSTQTRRRIPNRRARVLTRFSRIGSPAGIRCRRKANSSARLHTVRAAISTAPNAQSVPSHQAAGSTGGSCGGASSAALI